MTKSLTLATCIAILLATATALLLRYELAIQGVSPLFRTAEGIPNATLFHFVVVLHSLLSCLSVLLIGTLMCNLAHAKSAPFAAACLKFGIFVILLVLVLLILALLPPLQIFRTEFMESYGLEHRSNSALGQLMISFGRALDIPGSFTLRFLAIPSVAMLYLGAFTMISTLPHLRKLAQIGVACTVLVSLYTVRNMINGGFITAMQPYFVLTIGVVICAVIHLFAARKPDAKHAPWLNTLGLGAALISAAYLHSFFPLSARVPFDFNVMAAQDGTAIPIVLIYVFPFGLAWFAVPAMMLFQNPNTLIRHLEWGVTMVIAISVGRWIVPFLELSKMGAPENYMDFPRSFADLQWAISLNAAISVGVISAALLGLWTNRNRVTR